MMMKMKTLVIFFAFICSAAIGQQATLTVHIANTVENQVKFFSISENLDEMLSPGESKQIFLEVDGSKQISFFLNRKNYTLKIADKDSVTITLSGSREEDISIKGGTFEKLNDYFKFKSWHMPNSWSKAQSTAKAEDFKTSMDGLLMNGNKKIENLLSHGLVDSILAKEEKMYLKYFVHVRKLDYPFMNARYNFKKIPDSLPLFTQEVLSDEVLNNPETVKYGNHLLGKLIYYFGHYNEAKHPSVPNSKTLGALEFIEANIRNPEIKSIVAEILINVQLNNYSTANIEPALLYFTENCTDGTVVENTMEKIAEMSGLGPGAPAPEIELITMDGEKKYLSDFKGKNVYIDVWATYCGKCLAEMPNFRKLEHDYQDKNWIFLSVSLDTNVKKWKKKAMELGHLENQFIVEKGHKSKFNEDYRIGYAPRYIIIDKEGKLVNFNAPMPSNMDTRPIMDSITP